MKLKKHGMVVQRKSNPNRCNSFPSTHKTHTLKVRDYICEKATSGRWTDEIHKLVLAGWHSVQDLFSCSLGDVAEQQQEIETHFAFLTHLLKMRTMSLCAEYMLPPNRFAGLLSPDGACHASSYMATDWDLLLRAEAAAAAGQDVWCLPNVHWRLNTVFRMIMCLNQTAHKKGVFPHEAAHLVCLCIQHLGDSAIVENVHQLAKDFEGEHFYKKPVLHIFYCPVLSYS